MKRKLKALGIAILSLAILAPAAALACGGKGRHGHYGKKRRGAHFKKVISKLNLDDSQKAQIAALRTQSKAERGALRGQLRTAKKQLRALMRSQSPNQSAIMAQLSTVNDLRFKMKKLRVASMLQFRALLTPQQQAQLSQLKKQRRAKWKARRKAFGNKMKQRWNAQPAQ